MSAENQRKVLISPAFGAGWSTWNDEYAEDFLFDADLIAAVERGEELGSEDDPATPLGAFKAKLVAKHGEDAGYVYFGGARDLTVALVHGQFLVEEYDGSESILERDGSGWR